MIGTREAIFVNDCNVCAASVTLSCARSHARTIHNLFDQLVITASKFKRKEIKIIPNRSIFQKLKGRCCGGRKFSGKNRASPHHVLTRVEVARSAKLETAVSTSFSQTHEHIDG